MTRVKLDEKKSALELKLEKVSEILERTHPEQKQDAMSDYSQALAVLGNTKDYMTEPLILKLKRLYVYPNRKEHNQMLIELHDLIELMYEMRINEHLQDKRLGEENKPKSKILWWAVIAVSLYILTR